MSKRIPDDPPTGRSIDIETLVNAIDPDPGREEVYPARQPGQRSFYETDPFAWTEDNDVDD